jgi:hypothetical protein
MTVRQHLEELGACSEALTWLGERTAKQAWEECPKANWLMWWAARTPANSHTQIVLATCQCARRALRFVPAHEHRPQLAIEAAEQWAKKPTDAHAKAADAAGEIAVQAIDAARKVRKAKTTTDTAATAAWWAAVAAAWAVEDGAATVAGEAAAWAAEAAERTTAGAVKAEHLILCPMIRLLLVQPWSEPTTST